MARRIACAALLLTLANPTHASIGIPNPKVRSELGVGDGCPRPGPRGPIPLQDQALPAGHLSQCLPWVPSAPQAPPPRPGGPSRPR